MSSIIVKGIAYELTDNPDHGIVRDVRKSNKEATNKFVRKYRKDLKPGMTVPEALQAIFDKHPEEIIEFDDVGEQCIVASTISLATNKVWSFDMIDAAPYKEIKAAFEKAKETLGGDATTFL